MYEARSNRADNMFLNLFQGLIVPDKTFTLRCHLGTTFFFYRYHSVVTGQFQVCHLKLFTGSKMSQRYFEGANHAAIYAMYRPIPPTKLIDRIILYFREKVRSLFLTNLYWHLPIIINFRVH